MYNTTLKVVLQALFEIFSTTLIYNHKLFSNWPPDYNNVFRKNFAVFDFVG